MTNFLFILEAFSIAFFGDLMNLEDIYAEMAQYQDLDSRVCCFL